MPNSLKYISPQTKRYTPIKQDSEISTYRIKHKKNEFYLKNRIKKKKTNNRSNLLQY